MNLGSLIKKARKKRCLSQAELADLAGVTQAAISFIESSSRPNPSITTFLKIHKVLKLEDSLSILFPDFYKS